MKQTALEFNLETIKKFLNDREAEGLSKRRLDKYYYILKKLSVMLNKEFSKANLDDIKQLVIKVQNNGYQEATISDYKLFIKVFYRWLMPIKNDPDAYPELVRWIKVNGKHGNNKLPEELLTQEEVKRMIEIADVHDKAFVSLLYESGMRAGEIKSIYVKSLKFDEFGAIIIIPQGKTGSRRIMVHDCIPYLQNWINLRKAKSDDYLFITKDNRNERLTDSVMNNKVKALAQKAGLDKRVHPHLFRHSRATFLANFLTEAQMKSYFGWVKDSKMASVYVHLSGRDTDTALLSKVYNIQPVKDEIKDYELKPKICIYCNTSNEATAKFCNKCQKPVDPKSRIQFEEKRELAYQKLQLLYEKKPEIIDVLVKALLEIEERSD